MKYHIIKQQSTDIELLVVSTLDVDVPLPKSWDNYCPCHPSRKLKEGKWWEAFAMVWYHSAIHTLLLQQRNFLLNGTLYTT